MVWKEKYKVGVGLIDGQHMELFERVTDFLTTLRSEGTWDEKIEKVIQTLDFMGQYVVYHFADEENYQSKVGYPGMIAHIAIHRKFTEEMKDFADQFSKDKNNEAMIQRFAGKLLAWLINHVAAEDQKIGNFVRSNEGGNL